MSERVNTGHDEHGYGDNAYIAQPVTNLVSPRAKSESTDPRAVFTAALKARFVRQREEVRRSTSVGKVAELDDHHPVTFPARSNKAHAQWLRLLSTRAPLPTQLRSMEEDTVSSLLELIQKSYLVKGRNVNHITSAWIFSLLARLDEVGNMTNDQVFPLRELAKAAVLVQLSFTNPTVAMQLEDTLNQGEAGGSSQAVEEQELDIAEPVADLNTCVDDVRTSNQVSATDNTMATLDMIITIVGEVFGQRDLLEFRSEWAANETVE